MTPYSNDKGIDVVAIKNRQNYLIQAKQSKSQVGIGAIQEIFAGKIYYEEKFCERFKLLVISNNDFSSSAITLSKTNNVKMFNRSTLEAMIKQNEVSIQDVNRHESQRMKII